LTTIFEDLQPPPGCAALLGRYVLDEPAALIRDGGVINHGCDVDLDELRAIQTNCDGFLLDLEGREKARTGITNLRVQFNKVHGFYIEVTQGQLDKVPDDYRRRQTLKNAERYITPELKAFEDKALSAQERALAREKWLYEQLLDQLQPVGGARCPGDHDDIGLHRIPPISRSAMTPASMKTATIPLTVKNAASSRERSSGFTIAFSYARSMPATATPA